MRPVRFVATFFYLATWFVLLGTHAVAGNLDRWAAAGGLLLVSSPAIGFLIGHWSALLLYGLVVLWCLIPGTVVSGASQDLAAGGFADSIGFALLMASPVACGLIAGGIAVWQSGLKE